MIPEIPLSPWEWPMFQFHKNRIDAAMPLRMKPEMIQPLMDWAELERLVDRMAVNELRVRQADIAHLKPNRELPPNHHGAEFISYERNSYALPSGLADKMRRLAWAISRHGWDEAAFPGVVKLGSGYFSRVYYAPWMGRLVLKIGGPEGFGYDRRDNSRKSARGADAYPAYIAWTKRVKAKRGDLPSWAPRVHMMEAIRPRVYFAVVERLYPRGKSYRGYRDPQGTPSSLLQPRIRFDMHGGNVMMRQDGSTVVSDPWAGCRYQHAAPGYSPVEVV